MEIIPVQSIFEYVLQLIPIGVFWKDKERRFLGANKMFLDYYGLSSVDEILGKTDEDMGWHIDPEPFKSIELRVINNGETVSEQPGQCIVKGNIRLIRASKAPLIVDGKIEGLIGYFRDVTEEVAERDRLNVLSQTDELTGLLNRRAYSDISRQYEIQFKKEGSDFVLYMIDIDEFRLVNDNYGHEYGNMILQAAAKSLVLVASDNSVVFRYGGDEFVVLHQFTDLEEVGNLEKRICAALESPRNIDGLNIRIKVSVGHALFSETYYLSDMIEYADRRMYDMKRHHKHNHQV
ncbi:MAG: GGDEF domain-containing protein [Butyrivibrio sp.]|nr:GGDEF domain-containing protein [Butyrivibrio sp.]